MFDKYMICEGDLENIVEDGRTIGFAFLARLPYYRGLGFSMIEDIAVTLDGETLPREAIRVVKNGRSWTLDDMETEYIERWNFGEKVRIVVRKDGGLSAGRHVLELAERLRISYLPFEPTTRDRKEVEIVA